MPPEAKDKLTSRIDYLHEKMLEAKIRDIRSAKTLSELAKVYQDLGEDSKVNSVSQAVSSSLQELANARLEEILLKASSMAGSNNYADAKSSVTEESNRLQQEIRSVADDKRIISVVTSAVN